MPAEGTEPLLTTAPSLGDQAYRVLRQMITNGDLGRGERITERALGLRLGVSPTPIREALRRLEHERLIERRDGRHVSVVDPTLVHLAQLNLIQGALRGVAARLAAESASEDELAQIAATYEQSRAERDGKQVMRAARRIGLTRRFHDLIDQAAHNEVLVDMISTTTAFDLGERIRAAEALRDRYPAQTGLDEHGRIVTALLARDGDAAEQLIRAHISRTGEFFLAQRQRPNDE